ncbi:hypothetical protein BK022_19645 [Methylorubrum extorquens]|uniref:Uncharacterized protein n=1 Tax=Methylorubrum extorquens TaxID=408 RepID=A0A1S1P2F2_METEX|nr:hypothetical protein BK022_19645 [Methylorubrum extorquens]
MCGVAHHLLQHPEIIEEAGASGGRQAAEGLRPVLVVALLQADEVGLLQHGEVAAEIASVSPHSA